MKKKIAFIMALVMTMMFSVQSVGAINVIMNSSFVEFPDQEPVIKNGSTLVPIRPIAEKLGLEILWDDPTDTVTLKKDNFYIELVIGSVTAKTSSGEKTLSIAPEIINGRTMVPLRFIAEELGLTVSWNDEYQRVVIAGEVDTFVETLIPTEETTDVADGDENSETEENTKEPVESDTTEGAEEETEVLDETAFAEINSQSAMISFEIPVTFIPEDTEDEESFAFRSLDAFDAQHTYNWEIVSDYQSFADESGTTGVLYIVQELGPYEGEVYDVARAMDEYPEAPEAVELDFEYIAYEASRLIVEQICSERGVEVPEGYEDMEGEELALAIGFESAEEMNEYMAGVDTQAIMEQIPEYVDYMNYREEYLNYRREFAEINNAKAYAIRMFSEVQEEFDDETWALLFNSVLNGDPEVRYEGVEMVEIEGKKFVHATIYAEDPDDEQGVYDYYEYHDGDCVVTIFGGTLFGSEPGEEIVEVLGNLNIQ